MRIQLSLAVLEEMRERFGGSLSESIRKHVKATLARDTQLLRKDFEYRKALFGTGMIKPSLPAKPGYIICNGKGFPVLVPGFPVLVPDVRKALRDGGQDDDAWSQVSYCSRNSTLVCTVLSYTSILLSKTRR